MVLQVGHAYRTSISENVLKPVPLFDRSASGSANLQKLKLIIDAGADQVGVEFRRDIGAHNRRERRISQVDEEVFEPCRPVIGEGALNAAAYCPAGLISALPVIGCVDDDVAEGDATGDIEQSAVGGIAKTRAQGREPLVLGLAGNGQSCCADRRAASDPGAVKIAFKTEVAHAAKALATAQNLIGLARIGVASQALPVSRRRGARTHHQLLDAR
jgi:hypothetical protein